MNSIIWIVTIIVGIGIGWAIGFFLHSRIASGKVRRAEEEASGILNDAKAKEKEVGLAAKEEAAKIKSDAEGESRRRQSEVSRQEKRINQRAEKLDRKIESAERREEGLQGKEKDVENRLNQAEKLKEEQRTQLEAISAMSTSEAKEHLLKVVENETRDDLAQRIRKVEEEGRAQSDDKARKVIAEALQRCASEVSAESTVSVVPLPGDEMKGRIIGREGRNIRALENATGVDIIVDDTPEAVNLSCFNPVRREIARVALEKLIIDGRIHPARIEEMVENSRKEVEDNIVSEGEQLAFKAGVVGLHPEIIKSLGRLKYRFSYGQNILTHSLEVSELSAALAAEIGADVETAKTAGLLHDIGKATDQDTTRPHALVGANLIKRLGASQEIVDAVMGHHGEVESMSMYAFIVSAADAISSARPGARKESIESYIKRIEALENIANSFSGVDKSFAIQAGREIRILVEPQEIDDLEATRLARDIVKRIEEELEYPGQVKITVIRETRSVEYAK